MTSRTEPNVDDPFSEPTIQRRVWASYRQAGMSRYAFAKKLGVAYSTVDNWDTGKAMPEVTTLLEIAKLLQVPIEKLLYGHEGLAGPDGREPQLTEDGIRAVLSEVHATPAQRAALGEFRQSPAGLYQEWTRSFVLGFLGRYNSARAAGATAAEAAIEGLGGGMEARAVTAALSGDARPVSREKLQNALKRPRRTVKSTKRRKRVERRS
jgi:transcriptional regulator with XRE-family HTH domain